GAVRRWIDELDRLALAARESGAQRLVPPRDGTERGGEGGDVQRAVESQRAGHVVGGIAGAQAVQEPEALLGEGGPHPRPLSRLPPPHPRERGEKLRGRGVRG